VSVAPAEPSGAAHLSSCAAGSFSQGRQRCSGLNRSTLLVASLIRLTHQPSSKRPLTTNAEEDDEGTLWICTNVQSRYSPSRPLPRGYRIVREDGYQDRGHIIPDDCEHVVLFPPSSPDDGSSSSQDAAAGDDSETTTDPEYGQLRSGERYNDGYLIVRRYDGRVVQQLDPEALEPGAPRAVTI
jgi:hypothetical protein